MLWPSVNFLSAGGSRHVTYGLSTSTVPISPFLHHKALPSEAHVPNGPTDKCYPEDHSRTRECLFHSNHKSGKIVCHTRLDQLTRL